MMSTTFSAVQEHADIVWNLERSRLILSLESEMTLQERSAAKYWTVQDGRRCFMLPTLTQTGLKQYFDDYVPKWHVAELRPN
eukprot:gene165-2783_t